MLRDTSLGTRLQSYRFSSEKIARKLPEISTYEEGIVDQGDTVPYIYGTISLRAGALDGNTRHTLLQDDGRQCQKMSLVPLSTLDHHSC